MEMPCWCPSEGHKHGGRKSMKTSGIHFCSSNDLLFSHEPLYIQINFPPNTLTVQTAKNHKESPFLHKRKLCHRHHVGVM